jgi:hypothetical protein
MVSQGYIEDRARELVAAGKFADIEQARLHVRQQAANAEEADVLAKRFEPGYPLG